MSNAGGMATVTRYTDMLAGNTVWNPWEPEGAFDSLATITVPSGGLASVTFAGIPNTYKHLQIRCLAQTNRATYGIDEMSAVVNADNGSNYSSHTLLGDGASALVFAYTTQTKFFSGGVTVGTSTGSNFGATIIDVLDYASTSKNKTARVISGTDMNGTIAGFGGRVGLTSGLWMNSTTAISSIQLAPAIGSLFTVNSQFSLYGVR
jgi:hypothetical protein